MKTNTHRSKVFCRFIVAAFALAGSSAVFAEENCGAWHPPDNDPTQGQFMLELRSCDLAMGVSAYIQIRNNGEDRVSLSYRLITKDDKQKDNDIILEPYTTVRASNCQACASRYAGLKSWDILSAKSLGKAPPPEKAAPVAPAVTTPDAVTNTSNTKAPTTPVPATVTPATAPTPPVSAVPVTTSTTTITPVITANETKASKTETPKEEIKKEKLTEKDGFKAEDGTIIPWDQLPPEFRPRNKSESNKN